VTQHSILLAPTAFPTLFPPVPINSHFDCVRSYRECINENTQSRKLWSRSPAIILWFWRALCTRDNSRLDAFVKHTRMRNCARRPVFWMPKWRGLHNSLGARCFRYARYRRRRDGQRRFFTSLTAGLKISEKNFKCFIIPSVSFALVSIFDHDEEILLILWCKPGMVPKSKEKANRVEIDNGF
jgi:hypothetical protein